MSKKIHAIYDDEEVLLKAVGIFREKEIKIKDAYTPFAVHGLDTAMNIPRTRLGIVSFIFGITGTALALLGMWYFMIKDWPMDIGGKPSFTLLENLPSFIPITFEFTVLLAGHGMALTFLLRSWILPGVSAKNPDPRTTDDKFLLEFEASNSKTEGIISKVAKDSGASEVNTIE